MNTHDKLVTVCIPAYNHENFVQETITSIIEQTYENIELIIINDGSPDNTHDKIMELYAQCEKRFTNFTYINRENRGLIATLNEFIELSEGYYFTVIASDDFCAKNKTELQVKALEEHPDYAMCYGNMLGVDNDSNITKRRSTKYNVSGELFEKILFRNFITAPTVMLKRDVLIDVGGYDPKYKIEDHPMWLKISKKYKILYIDEDLVYYRDHENNMSKNVSFMIEENEKMLADWSHEPTYPSVIQRAREEIHEKKLLQPHGIIQSLLKVLSDIFLNRQKLFFRCFKKVFS
jgi:alpha-1,3-rhamnosyltransferase